MWKKGLLFAIVFVICVALGGIVLRTKFPDGGLVHAVNEETLGEQHIFFKSADTESEAQYYREHQSDYIEQNEDCACVFVARPTGNIQPGSVNSMQEVTVQKVIKGDRKLEQEQVWIDAAVPGFIIEDGAVYMDAATNFMQQEDEYLIFCNGYGSVMLENVPECAKYYAADCFFGYLNLTRPYSADGLVEEDKEYRIRDLKHAEFFAASARVLEERQKIKEKILQLYMDSI